MRDLTILLDSTQGTPATLLSRLAESGVPLKAGCLFPRTEGRVMHLGVDDSHVETVRKVAAAMGVTVVDDRECVVVPPGHLGGVAQVAAAVAGAGAMVQVAYFGRSGELVLATTDLEVTRRALAL